MPDEEALSAEQHSASESPNSFTDASEAARFLASIANQKRQEAKSEQPQEETQEQPAHAEQPDQPVSDQESDDEQETAPVEDGEEVETEDDLPPIDAPHSWPKEDKQFFASLPRQAQEIIARREQERDRHFLKGQNESAEQRRAIEAKTQEVEQLRQQYEAQLPAVTEAIQQSLLSEFPDIRTMEDVRKMAAEDWPRYIQWDAKTKELAQWQNAAQEAQQRQQQQQTEQLQNWVATQDEEVERALSNVPEKERQSLANEAKDALVEYGFTEDQIVQLWNSSILRSAPVQRMMADAARYRIAKRTASKPAAKTVPPVQKPGTPAKAQTPQFDAQIAALENKASLKPQEAVQLLSLKAQKRKSAA